MIQELINKYDAKLTIITNGIEISKHMLDPQTLELLEDFKKFLETVVTDLKNLKDNPN